MQRCWSPVVQSSPANSDTPSAEQPEPFKIIGITWCKALSTLDQNGLRFAADRDLIGIASVHTAL